MTEFRYWTEAEDARLRELYGTTLSVAEIAERIGRTDGACRLRAQVLGLRRPAQGWTATEDVALREGWGKVRTRELARRLGKSPGAVKQRARRLGLDSGWHYTAADKSLVRELYPTHTAEQIAARVGRSVASVYRLAHRLGLHKHPHWTDEEIDAVSDLNAEGLCDRVIAERLGHTLDQVKHIRQRFGWPHYPDVEAKRRAVENQRQTLGIRSGGQLRRLAYQRFAERNGWPEDVRPREVQILNALAARGVPMSKRELCAAIGMSDRAAFRSGNRRILLSGNGPGGTYTASLAARGLIVRLVRAGTVVERGKGHSVDLYVLGPAALAILEARAKCETAKTTP